MPDRGQLLFILRFVHEAPPLPRPRNGPGCKKGLYVGVAMDSPPGTPIRPVLGHAAQFGPQWIPFHIPQHHQQMLVRLDGESLKKKRGRRSWTNQTAAFSQFECEVDILGGSIYFSRHRFRNLFMKTVFSRPGVLLALALSLLCMSLVPASTASAGPFAFDLIADTHTAAPNQTPAMLYTDFGIPAIHRGRTVFRSNFPQNIAGTSQGNFERIDTGLPGVILTEVMRAQSAAGGSNGQLAGVTYDPVIFNGAVAWSGATQGGGGFFLKKSPNSPVLYVAGSGPGFGTNVSGIESLSLFNNELVFDARFNSVESLYLNSVLNPSVDTSYAVPGVAATDFALFTGYPDYNFRSLAFGGGWFLSNDFNNPLENGIYRWDRLGRTVTTIADKNVSIPAQPGNFDQSFGFFTTSTTSSTGSLGPAGSKIRPSISGSVVAFSYDDSVKGGVYRHVNGSLKRVADRLTKHPTLPGNFQNFRGVSTLGSATAFVATDAKGTQGLYLSMCNQIMEVLAEGPSFLTGSDIAEIELGNRGLAVGNPFSLKTTLELAFRVEFADGNSGIYWASTNMICANTGVLIGNKGVSNSVGSGGFSAKLFAEDSDISATIATSVASGSSAVFGADLDLEKYGVDANPGNDPTLIDYTLDGNTVVPERIDVSFNQAIEVHSLHLGELGPSDSLLIQLPNETMLVDSGQVIDGLLDLGGLLLPEGSTIGIEWDPNNSFGDGVSFNGVGLVAVPEPTAAVLMLALCCAAICLRKHL